MVEVHVGRVDPYPQSAQGSNLDEGWQKFAAGVDVKKMDRDLE